MSRQSLIECVKFSDNPTAKKISKDLIEDIQIIADSDNSTLLHLAANNNNFQLGRHFLQLYNELIEQYPDTFTLQTKKKWLTTKDNQGFSCLHYAVFRSNYHFAIFLEEQGADLYQINNQGLTVLHIAAQGDSPLLMFYYLSKGLKLEVLDSKGNTPLHWACYSGQQNAAFALISWGSSIDLQQQTFGMTPLHLAVISGNGRIVKKLLLKGCDRKIQNYNGKLALDIAKQNEYVNITEMIVDKRGVEELLNIKTPFRKLHRHTLPFYIFIFLFLSNYILNVSFVVSEHIKSELDLAITYLVLGVLVFISYLFCYFSNPGQLKKKTTESYFQILQKNKASSICYDCKIVKPDRSRHCEICETCVSVYDHHCPWVANCIGSDNYCYFFTFLIVMFGFLMFTIIYEIINLCTVDNWGSNTALQIIRVICEVYGLLCGVFFLIPLIFLLIVQTRNLFENKTTFERYGFNSTKQLRRSTGMSYTEESSLRNTLTERSSAEIPRGSFTEQSAASRKSTSMRNCYLMCFGNRNNPVYHEGV